MIGLDEIDSFAILTDESNKVRYMLMEWGVSKPDEEKLFFAFLFETNDPRFMTGTNWGPNSQGMTKEEVQKSFENYKYLKNIRKEVILSAIS